MNEWHYFCNTHLQIPLVMYRSVIGERDYASVLGPSRTMRNRRSVVQRVLERIWFWPRVVEATRWADSTSEFGWKPESFLHEEPTPLLEKVIQFVDRHDSVLDLGCNSGSDLNILVRHGFTSLAGVDVGEKALALFSEIYPSTYVAVKVHHDLFQRFLLKSRDREFDVVFSNGATIELVHPSFPIVKEIARVARKQVYLDLSETQGYPRDYVGQFRRSGFRLDNFERNSDVLKGSGVYIFTRTRTRTGN